jgi:MFS family permease
MTRADLTEKLLDIKRQKGWNWKYICGQIGGYSPVLIVGAILGQMKLTKPQAAKAGELFGLFQGGIVPSYAVIVREYFPAGEVGTRVGLVLMATLLGMALGGWMSGAIFDLTGSYRAAFANGLAWNLLNVSIAGWLLLRSRPREALA